MNPMEQLKTHFEELTKTEQRVAQAIIDEPTVFLSTTLTSLAKHSNTSNAAVIRMCQKLGFDGFSEFKYSMNRYLLSAGPESFIETDSVSAEDTHQNPLQSILNIYIRHINQLTEYVQTEQLQELADNILHAKRLVIWGINRTAQSATQLSNRLSRLGIYNKISTDPIVMLDDSNILDSEDLCILFTVNGRGSSEYASMISDLNERQCTTWVITMNPKLKCAQKSKNTVVLPWISRTSKINFYEDQVIIYLFIELLLYELVKIIQ